MKPIDFSKSCLVGSYSKKYHVFALTLLLLISLLPMRGGATPGGTAPALGDGSQGNPYQIATLQNLLWLQQDQAQWASGKYFIQTADIDASITSTWNGGAGWDPIGKYNASPDLSFFGSYDGQNHSITSLYIYRPAQDRVGLFGRTGSGSMIKNLRMLQVYFDGNSLVGGLAGQVYGSIYNCSATGSVHCPNYAGGLVGQLEFGSSVQLSFAQVSVSADNYAGGLAGTNTGSIANCYAQGSATANNYFAGGLVGLNDYYSGTIANCYSTGWVSAPFMAGGLVGQNALPGSMYGDPVPEPITNSYWDTLTSGRNTSDGGIGQNTAAMKTQGSFAGWDFTDGTGVWAIQTAAKSGGYISYPYFQTITYDQPGSTGGSNAMPGLSQVEIIWNGIQSSTSTVANNWNIGTIPANGVNIKFSPTAANDMILNQSMQLGNIDFNGSNKKIVLGNYNFTTTGFSNISNGNFVQTNGTGFLKINLPGILPPGGNQQYPGAPGGQPVLFPVGNGSYCPVSITNNTGADDVFGLRVEDDVYKNGSSGVSINENHVTHTWHISKTNPNAGAGVDFTFNWNADEVAYGNLATPSLYHHNGTNWEKQTGSSSNTATSFTYTGYSGSFSPFAVAEGATLLPVRNLQFTANRQGSDIALNWTTASEYNSKDFVVEHSLNGSNWTSLGGINAAGNSHSLRQYQYLHLQPASGNHYYRLLQRDLNGQQVYSPVVFVSTGNAKGLGLFPNPAKAGAILQLSLIQLPAGSYPVQLIGSNGQTVVQMRLQHHSDSDIHRINLPASLPAGLYRLQLPGTGLPVKTIMIQ